VVSELRKRAVEASGIIRVVVDRGLDQEDADEAEGAMRASASKALALLDLLPRGLGTPEEWGFGLQLNAHPDLLHPADQAD
jgi:hypothetical protein